VQDPAQRLEGWNKALAVIADLVAQRAFDDEFIVLAEQRLDLHVGPDNQIAGQTQMCDIRRDSFVDSLQPEHPRFGVIDISRLESGPRGDFPIDRNVAALDAGRIDVHTGLDVEIEDEGDVLALMNKVIARGGR